MLPAGSKSRSLIITADDFGLHPAVNRAVEQAHRHGLLSAASLMMGAPASSEAVELAHRLGSLRVGLHVMVAEGWASAPAVEVPAIADPWGVMDSQVLRRSFRFVRPAVARQLRREVQAQFAAFRRTGLTLDHVNVHKHLHMHPVVLGLLLDEIEGLGAIVPIRVPCEPLGVALESGCGAAIGATLLHGWARLAQATIRRRGVPCNDVLFGIAHTGRVDDRRMLEYLARLPPGVTEIYLHPADSAGHLSASMAGYRPQDELQALLSPKVRSALQQSAIRLGGYRDALPC